jgi:DNA-directed RNA polymerase specialized sigma24 family protein
LCYKGIDGDWNTLTIEPHEQIERYLPLNPERAERFVNEWEGFVLSCLRRMRVSDEEDVLFRIFYRALNALPDFRSDSKISTWLYRIAWREGLRHCEKQKRLAHNEAPILEAENEADPGEGALEVLEMKDLLEKNYGR